MFLMSQYLRNYYPNSLILSFVYEILLIMEFPQFKKNIRKDKKGQKALTINSLYFTTIIYLPKIYKTQVSQKLYMTFDLMTNHYF